MHFHLFRGPYLPSLSHLTCVFAGIAGAKELLIVESDCVRVAVKPNLQAEEGLAGEETYPGVDIYFLHFLFPILSSFLGNLISFSSSYTKGGFSGEAGDV